jgi:hypothetical protein
MDETLRGGVTAYRFFQNGHWIDHLTKQCVGSLSNGYSIVFSLTIPVTIPARSEGGNSSRIVRWRLVGFGGA